jgi:two-component system cell cycle response regulator
MLTGSALDRYAARHVSDASSLVAAHEQWADDARSAIDSVVRGAETIRDQEPREEISDPRRQSLAVIVEHALQLGQLLDGFAHASPLVPSAPAAREDSVRAAAPTAPALLIADDDEEIRSAMGDLLSWRYRLTFARDGGEAMLALRRTSFDLAILDVGLPVLDGLELVRTMRDANERPLPAFMFLSGQDEPRLKVRALALGAVDYVTKPFDSDELMARIARILRAVTREANLRAAAMTDPLTGLANGRSFAASLDRELARSRRYELPLSLLTVDLDHLKAINDAHGHDAGNEAIRLVARVLASAVRSFEVVARQGGDEFAVILPNTGAADARRLAERLRGEIGAQTLRDATLSVSIGGASLEGKSVIGAAALIKASDEALYRAKRAGRNRVEMVSFDVTAS